MDGFHYFSQTKTPKSPIAQQVLLDASPLKLHIAGIFKFRWECLRDLWCHPRVFLQEEDTPLKFNMTPENEPLENTIPASE